MGSNSVYIVTSSSNRNRTYLLKDDSSVLSFTHQAWGKPLQASWSTPELFAHDKTLEDSDFASCYSGSTVVAKRSACAVIQFSGLELLQVRIGAETRYVLNSQITLMRIRPEGVEIAQVPSGAIILMNKADFYVNDVPREPCLFWFHDGNFPRFLLCNAEFRSLVERAQLSGLSFKVLGRAR